jgi:homoserine kinase
LHWRGRIGSLASRHFRLIMPGHSSRPFSPYFEAPRSGVVRAFAPGGIGNLGPGLDILGCAITGLGDSVEAMLIDEPGIRVDEPGHPDLPTDPTKHASAIAANEVLRRSQRPKLGVALRVEKRLPLEGGQGGSAASAIAGALAVNALIGSPLDDDELLRAALVAEERVAGRHLDNLAPALIGGIVLVRSVEPLSLLSLPVPPALRIVVVHPGTRMRTADARSVLPAEIDRMTSLLQASAVAAMIAAFCTGELGLLRGAIDDRIAEPARAPLLPGFAQAKSAALDAGALGCSIAGGGPSSFALVGGTPTAEIVLRAMISAYADEGLQATGRVAEVDERGAWAEAVVAEAPPP